MELVARHFDEIILDDYFFVTTKNDSDIAAKGNRSWTQFRLDLMNEVGRNLVVGAARAVNPRVKVVIKYPNWYEHFAGLGFDLEQGPKIFDGIYTGAETRDPDETEQFLQQYESYADRPLLRGHRTGPERRRLDRHLRHPLCRPLCGTALGHDVRQGPRNDAVLLGRNA